MTWRRSVCRACSYLRLDIYVLGNSVLKYDKVWAYVWWHLQGIFRSCDIVSDFYGQAFLSMCHPTPLKKKMTGGGGGKRTVFVSFKYSSLMLYVCKIFSFLPHPHSCFHPFCIWRLFSVRLSVCQRFLISYFLNLFSYCILQRLFRRLLLCLVVYWLTYHLYYFSQVFLSLYGEYWVILKP